MSNKNLAEPQPSKINKFKISINYPEQWKIRSIAKYKQSQILKKQLNNSSSSDMNRFRVNSVGKIERSASFDTNGITVDQRSALISHQRRNISKEQIRHELEVFNRNSLVIRNKIQSLNVVRNSLIWLLKKSVQVDREVTSSNGNAL